ncbi:Arrestin domain-containing protein 15 [Trichinella sp. T6]|nr:Arrestin domain-containing protein 15 [Trichinella sp. T6]
MPTGQPSVSIFLDQNESTIKAGDTITGTLQLKYNSDEMEVTDIQVNVYGEAKASWVSKISDKIFDSSQTLIDQCDENTKCPHSAEDYQNSFHFHIPVDMPASVESKYGYIRYEINVSGSVIVKQVDGCFAGAVPVGPMRMKFAEKKITILGRVSKSNLCTLPPLFSETEDVFEELVCCFGQSSVKMLLQIPTWIMTAGDEVPVHVRLANSSNRQLKWFSLLLIQELHFSAQSRYEAVADRRQTSCSVCTINLPDVAPHEPFDENIILNIPANILPSTFRPCVVMVKYKLFLRIRGSVFHEICLPIYLASKI